MRRHARETIRRPKEYETDFPWDSEEQEKHKKSSKKSLDDEIVQRGDEKDER
ncbi:MAG: hypothetical protein AB7D92_10640 [Sphaerochaeta sp.]